MEVWQNYVTEEGRWSRSTPWRQSLRHKWLSNAAEPLACLEKKTSRKDVPQSFPRAGACEDAGKFLAEKKYTFTYSSGPCTSSLPLFLLFSGPTDWRTRGRWVALRRSQWARRWSRTSSTWWRGSWARGCGGRGPRRGWGRIWRWRWSPGMRRLDLCLRNDRPPGEGTALCHRSKLAPERQIQVYNIIDWSSDQVISYVFERELLITLSFHSVQKLGRALHNLGRWQAASPIPNTCNKISCKKSKHL